jgi:4-methoxybenzoate monooxygenase (O-demethylating)
MQMIEGHIATEVPDNVPVWDVDPYDPEILRAPEDYYAALREKGPFAYIPKYAILACGRHPEVKEVFSDWQRFVSSRGVGLQDFSLEKPWRPPSIILEADPPDHTVTRRVLARALSPKATAALKQAFQIAADALLDELLERDGFEGVADLAEAYPVSVFPDAVGLRQSDRRALIDYGAMVFNALGPDNDLRAGAMARGPDIAPWITQQCRRENLEPGGFGAAIYGAADAGEITTDQAAMLVRSLLSAGVDTTVTGIGNALWCLAANPEQFAALRADPSLVKPAFEEVLRYTSPVHSFCRTANLDTEVSGIAIRAGTKILCVLGAANLDQAQWPQADRFDVARRPMGHLAMGVGIHACVGQNLARAEAAAVLGAIAARVGRVEMTGPPVWRPNHAIHALDSLPLAFHQR